MVSVKRIDRKIQEGFRLREDKARLPDACDIWLEAWDEIKEALIESDVTEILKLNSMYGWMTHLNHYTQYLRMELFNAGVHDAKYVKKLIVFCQELLQCCGDDNDTIRDTRCDLAEAYYRIGEINAGETLYTDLIKEDADDAQPYVFWAYDLIDSPVPDSKNYDKAEEILITAFKRPALRQDISVLEALVNLYKAKDEPEKTKEYEELIEEQWRADMEDHKAMLESLGGFWQ